MNRTHCTKYSGATSKKLETEFGVPQGAKLAEILFIINDIGSSIKHGKIELFADDTLFYIRCNPDITTSIATNE